MSIPVTMTVDPHGPGWAGYAAGERAGIIASGERMYTRPSVVRFGTMRELTLGGSAANYDFGNANNNSCNTKAQYCWQPVPNARS